jgi:hypothetical protein
MSAQRATLALIRRGKQAGRNDETIERTNGAALLAAK